jgi:hypothetical protein
MASPDRSPRPSAEPTTIRQSRTSRILAVIRTFDYAAWSFLMISALASASLVSWV